MGVSYWTLRDLVLNGTLPRVCMPAARVDVGQRRGAKQQLPPERMLVDPNHPGVAGRAIRRVLLDREDLDRLIAQWKETQ